MSNEFNVAFFMSQEFIKELNAHLLFSGEFKHRINTDDLVHATVLIPLLDDEPLEVLRDSIPNFDERMFKVLTVAWFPAENGYDQYVELGLVSEN